MKKNIVVIVMASGKSRRMGENKLLLKYKGKTFIENLLEKIENKKFLAIFVVISNDVVKTICEKFVKKNKNFFIIENENFEKGQSESIKIGIRESLKKFEYNYENEDKIDGYMFFSGDQPMLTHKTIEKIFENFEENKIIIPKYKEKMGLPTIFSKKFESELLEISGDIGGKPVILNNLDSVKFVEIENENEGIDIDDKNQYEKLLEMEKF